MKHPALLIVVSVAVTIIVGVAFDVNVTAQSCCSTGCIDPCTAACIACNQDVNSCGSPIIVDVRGDGFSLTNTQDGVDFDFFGVGKKNRIAWTARNSGNAFLVLDRNHNGRIDDATELFGNFTPQPPSANRNGFAALAVFDRPQNGGNGDGVIDASDAEYSQLRLWVDANHNGISEPDELFTLSHFGVRSISLDYKLSERVDEFGNRFRYRSTVQRGSGSDVDRVIYDVFLVIKPLQPTT